MQGCGLESFGSKQGPVASPCEYGDETSRYIKFRQFLDWQRKY
jgi:hypothetical protein